MRRPARVAVAGGLSIFLAHVQVMPRVPRAPVLACIVRTFDFGPNKIQCFKKYYFSIFLVFYTNITLTLTMA
jgi:hypothetical protein